MSDSARKEFGNVLLVLKAFGGELDFLSQAVRNNVSIRRVIIFIIFSSFSWTSLIGRLCLEAGV